MIRNLRWTLFVVLTTACTGASPQSADLVIRHVTVVDVLDGSLHQDQTLFVESGRLTAVLPSPRTSIPAGARVVDGAGQFAVPGLWDAHVHSAASKRAWDFPLLVAHGITSVRNMHADGDALEEVRSIKHGLASGEFVGPRYLANGPLVDGYPPVHRGSVVVRTASEARAAVDSLADGGADFIKVYDSLTLESYHAILDQARRRGIAVDGHMPFAVSPTEAARAGQRTVEHLTGIALGCSSDIDAIRSDYVLYNERMPQMDPDDGLMGWLDLIRRASDSLDSVACAAVVAAYAETGVAVVPTLTYMVRHADPQPILTDPTARRLVLAEAWDRWNLMAGSGAGEAMASVFATIHEQSLGHVRALHAAGVPILAGTDLGNEFIVAGRSLHDELAALVSAGLSPLEALQSATSAPARVFGLSDSLGTVTAGSIADLVLLEDNPLEDINNVRKITGVVLRGEYFDRPRLDSLVNQAVATEAPPN